MKRFIAVGVAADLLFTLLDGLINATPLAKDLSSVYASIARPSVNAVAGRRITAFSTGSLEKITVFSRSK